MWPHGWLLLLQDAGSVFLLQSAEPPAVPSHPGPVQALWSQLVSWNLSWARGRLPEVSGPQTPTPRDLNSIQLWIWDAELGS